MIKIQVGSALYLTKKLTVDVKGRDMVTGLPRITAVNSDDVVDALQDELAGLITAIKQVLYNTPPELSADIMDKGIVLSGGTSLLRNIDELISEAIGVPAYNSDEPILCVAKGTGIALESLDAYKRSILAAK